MIAIYNDFADLLIMLMTAMRISQERLAEECGISRLTVSNYCCAKSVPNAEVIQRIAESLQSPLLTWEWLRTNQIGRELLPKLPNMPLSQAYSYLYSAVSRVAEMHRELNEITKDNRIEPHEYDTYLAGKEVVVELIAHGALYKMAKQEKAATANSGLR